ncbi:hypothetical protein O6H91_16G092500 [Diphasiastrum complanatum]|uniref:Uncharacterized protein n=4 Tax=Diphasiastrum complanatum TaxID=34168 RepID=A0ACC2BEZ7_DIPCM|nr:hypothetical protein O6H91_Y085900 [Diphasiastrum complanatum]KAJ7528275.1 hypothetical protein O6H91_16G092500 [Diphasiastrum complanatum]
MADENEAREKDGSAWSAQATSELITAFQEKRMEKKRVDVDWRIFRSEDWDAVADWINARCGFLSSKDRKTGKQCQYKIGNLKRRFKSESAKGGISDWRWYFIMEEIFAGETLGGGSLPSRRDEELRPPPTTDNCHPPVLEIFDQNRAGENRPEEPTSCSMPASKTASTTDMDRGSPGIHYVMAAASGSGPSSPRCKQLTSIVSSEHVRKRNSSSEASPSEAFADSISKSMKMMAMQQGEMIRLMRQMVEGRTNSTHSKLEAAEDAVLKKEVADVRRKVETVENDLIPLKQICEQKEKELQNALHAYNEKQDLRHSLYNELMEMQLVGSGAQTITREYYTNKL